MKNQRWFRVCVQRKKQSSGRHAADGGCGHDPAHASTPRDDAATEAPMTVSANILITGPPGIGKTTLIRNVCRALADQQIAGFYTAEMRQDGERRGFELVGLDGQRAVLAHVDIRSPFRVGKYGVDVDALERFTRNQAFFEPATDLIVIDEIGKMECFSAAFRLLAQRVLASETPVVASVAQRGGGLIAEVKDRWDVKVLSMGWDNRDHLLPQILGQLP
jgi:nucleoside-triphosphatase